MLALLLSGVQRGIERGVDPGDRWIGNVGGELGERDPTDAGFVRGRDRLRRTGMRAGLSPAAYAPSRGPPRS